jgi:hypothetical protein
MIKEPIAHDQSRLLSCTTAQRHTFGANAKTFDHLPPGTPIVGASFNFADTGPDIRDPIISPFVFSKTHVDSSNLRIVRVVSG